MQKNLGENFPGEVCTRNFWGGVSRYAATPLVVALSPGHSDITSDRKSFGSQRKDPSLLRRLTPSTLLIRIQAFRNPFRGELPHVQIFMNDRPNTPT